MCEPCSDDPDEGGDAEPGAEPHVQPEQEIVPLDEHEERERADEPPQEARFRAGGHASAESASGSESDPRGVSAICSAVKTRSLTVVLWLYAPIVAGASSVEMTRLIRVARRLGTKRSVCVEEACGDRTARTEL